MSRETTTDIVIYTGGDPRNLAAFESLRQEINKISHPAQPEVNWRHMELLALEIFRNNGVDLQTLSYYTLARSRRAGLAGFTEGCELLAGIVTNEWEKCWPENEAARVEILNWFNARLGAVLRALSFNDKSLRLLYRSERALQLICDKLQQVPLDRLPRTENLLIFIQNSVQRVEQQLHSNRSAAQSPASTSTLVWMPTGCRSTDDRASMAKTALDAPLVKVSAETPAPVASADRKPISFTMQSWWACALGALLTLLDCCPSFLPELLAASATIGIY